MRLIWITHCRSFYRRTRWARSPSPHPNESRSQIQIWKFPNYSLVFCVGTQAVLSAVQVKVQLHDQVWKPCCKWMFSRSQWDWSLVPIPLAFLSLRLHRKCWATTIPSEVSCLYEFCQARPVVHDSSTSEKRQILCDICLCPICFVTMSTLQELPLSTSTSVLQSC